MPSRHLPYRHLLYQAVFTVAIVAVAGSALPAVGADASQLEANPLYKSLLSQGFAWGTQVVTLPEPTVADGLTAEQQTKALETLADANRPLDQLVRDSVVAPFVLKLTNVEQDGQPTTVRRIDLWYVAYGDFAKLSQKGFLQNLFDSSGRKDPNLPEKSGELTAEDLAKRMIKVSPETDSFLENFGYGTFGLFDKVLISSTHQSISTKTAESYVVASKVDARFNADADYPNQWQPLEREPSGKYKIGDAQPYSGGALYIKATQLKAPEGAILIEYHQVFDEPKGWFGGANLLRSKLPILAQEEIRTFRRKLKS